MIRADVVRLVGTVIASGVLGLQVLVLAGREIAPQLALVELGGALARDRGEELALAPAGQPPGQYLTELEIVREVKARTPATARFLVFNQNIFAFYAERRFIRDVDLRLVPFYRAGSDRAAIAALDSLGIDYVYLPPWTDWPTIKRSRILSLLEKPANASLVYEQAGFRLYRWHGPAAPSP